MKAKVLIIEDVVELSDLIAMYLSKEGMEIKQSESAELAFEILKDFSPDLVVLDINLPGMDGFEFLHEFRKTASVPVLIVSARNADEDIITGLGYGADEFVTKPFSPRVLVARVRAMLRRSVDSENKKEQNIIKFGDFLLYTDSCVLKKGNERISLSAKEYKVLEWFCKNAGKPMDPETIYNAVWDTEYGDLTAVAVYVQRLRKKIENDLANPKYLETVYGMGYRFNLENNE